MGSYMDIKFMKYDKKLLAIEKNTQHIPNLYNAVDSFMGEIIRKREREDVVDAQMANCSERIAVIEKVVMMGPKKHY